MLRFSFLLRAILTGAIFVSFACIAAGAQNPKAKTKADRDRIEQKMNRAFDAYGACLDSAYFDAAKIFNDKKKMADSARTNCNAARKAAYAALSNFMGPPPKAKAVFEQIEITTFNKIDEEYMTETTMRLSMMATSLTAQEVCQKANKEELSLFYNSLHSAMLRDFAYFRPQEKLDTFIKKYRYDIQLYVERDGIGKWCDKTKAVFDGAKATKNFFKQ